MKKDFTVVFGDMAYDAKTETIECPPTTVNNRKKLPQKGRQMPEGEMAIKVGYARYGKDENGKIANVQFLSKEEYLANVQTEEELAKQGLHINEFGEIIRETEGIEI